MPVNLPTELLRSFAAIVDTGSMLRATERVFVTQSALSLQMMRLEDTVQATLFHRDGRRLALTPAGHNLLGYAREILAINDRALRDTALGRVEGYEELLPEVNAVIQRIEEGRYGICELTGSYIESERLAAVP